MDPRSIIAVITDIKDEEFYELGTRLDKLKALYTRNQFALCKVFMKSYVSFLLLVDKDSGNATVQRSVPRRCVCANQPIYIVTQNVTAVNLAVKSDFNYDLIILKEILINKFHLFHEHFLLMHYLSAVKYKTVKFNVILGFV
jgi:hypothetical protein